MNVMLGNKSRVVFPWQSRLLRDVVRKTLVALNIADLQKQIQTNLTETKASKALLP